jgi:hypothetical protein
LRAKAQQEQEEAQGRTTVMQRYELTDLGNANRLEHHFGDVLRYVAP